MHYIFHNTIRSLFFLHKTSPASKNVMTFHTSHTYILKSKELRN